MDGSRQDDSIAQTPSLCATSEKLTYMHYDGGMVGGLFNVTSCKTCASGYGLRETTQVSSNTTNHCTVTFSYCVKEAENPCPSNCPSQVEYTSQTGSRTGQEAICVIEIGSGATCEYRCKRGYYNTSVFAGGITCTACPANATCSNNEASCNIGYYKRPKQSGVISNIVNCDACPTYNNGSSSVSGLTAAAGAQSITDCYEPKGTGHVQIEYIVEPGQEPTTKIIGKYNILTDKKCFYVDE